MESSRVWKTRVSRCLPPFSGTRSGSRMKPSTSRHSNCWCRRHLNGLNERTQFSNAFPLKDGLLGGELARRMRCPAAITSPIIPSSVSPTKGLFMHWNLVTVAGMIALGFAIGTLSGMLGIGGGVLVMPALIFIFGMTHTMAVGTSLGMLLPPIGIAAFLTYYRAGQVDLTAAALLAVGFMAGAYVGAVLVTKQIIPAGALRPTFAFFLLYVAGNMLFRSEGRVADVLYTQVKTIALMIAFALSFILLRRIGKRWERSISMLEIYAQRLERALPPAYVI